MMHPHDRIFDLSGARSDLSGATAAETATLRAEPWFNETLTLVNYVGGTMDLGCQCNVHYDYEKWSPSCEKMLVAGDFRSERKEIRRDDGGPFFPDWVQRGIVQRVSYFPGSKHVQARLTLHLPP